MLYSIIGVLYKKYKADPKSNFNGLNHSGSYNLLMSGRIQGKEAGVFLIASDAAKYCGGILEELGPLCGYETAKVLLEQIGMFLIFVCNIISYFQNPFIEYFH